VAITILRISSISEDDVAGEVRAMSGQTITIDTGRGATTLHLDGSTRFRGAPQAGDVVVARTDGNRATSIELVFATDSTFTFSGDVTSIRGNDWTVQGVDFTVTSATRVTGAPQVGDRATVMAFGVNDRWYAMTVDKL
jgi:flagellar capping protein FliD